MIRRFRPLRVAARRPATVRHPGWVQAVRLVPPQQGVPPEVGHLSRRAVLVPERALTYILLLIITHFMLHGIYHTYSNTHTSGRFPTWSSHLVHSNI